jgi:Inner membrane component of T3SS, cytoplasmic domain
MSALFLEVVSRHGDVQQRLKLDPQTCGLEGYSLGRSLESNFVLDDAYVAPLHARLTYENDQWVLRDAGSINGIGLESATVRELVLRTDAPVAEFTLGQTQLRVRDAMAAATPERVLPPKQVEVSAATSVGLIAALVGLLGLGHYASAIAATSPTSWLAVYQTPVLVLLGWVVFWSVLTRVFVGAAHFMAHLRIAALAALGLAIWPWVVRVISYAFSAPGLAPATEIGGYLLMAWAIAKHLHVVFGPLKAWQKSALAGLAMLPILGSVFQQQDRRGQWFDNGTLKTLADPALQVTRNKSAAHLLDGLQGKRAEIDALIKRAEPNTED